MLLPLEIDARVGLSVGWKAIHRFPSGPYELIVGDETCIGRYRMCLLFSPMFELPDPETAVPVAEEAMLCPMEEETRDRTGMREREIARNWNGGSEDEEREETEPAAPTLSTERPIGRRELPRGDFSRGP